MGGVGGQNTGEITGHSESGSRATRRPQMYGSGTSPGENSPDRGPGNLRPGASVSQPVGLHPGLIMYRPPPGPPVGPVGPTTLGPPQHRHCCTLYPAAI